jgi:hypothetical protein
MRKLYADLIQEQTTTAGTGAVTLTQVPGWVRFNDRFAAADRVYYMIESGTSKEVGYGTYSGGNVLARTTILGTLVAGVADWATATAITLAGTSTVRAVAPESLFQSFVRAAFTPVSVNGPIADGGSYAVIVSSLTLQLPAVPAVGDRLEVFQALAGITGTIIDPNGANINGVAGSMSVDIDNFAFWLVYTGVAHGWKVQQ